MITVRYLNPGIKSAGINLLLETLMSWMSTAAGSSTSGIIGL